MKKKKEEQHFGYLANSGSVLSQCFFAQLGHEALENE